MQCRHSSSIACKADERVIDSLFLYYNLDNRYEEFRLLSDGTSTRGGLSGWILKRMEIMVPPLQEQRKIAGILKALDDKIEMNNEINKNLPPLHGLKFIKNPICDGSKKTEIRFYTKSSTRIPHFPNKSA